MAIADIVTRGFGIYSSVYKIATRGYSIGEEEEGYAPLGVHYSVSDNRPHYVASDNRPHYSVD